RGARSRRRAGRACARGARLGVRRGVGGDARHMVARAALRSRRPSRSFARGVRRNIASAFRSALLEGLERRAARRARAPHRGVGPRALVQLAGAPARRPARPRGTRAPASSGQAGALAGLLLPAGLERAPGGEDRILSGLADLTKMASVSDALIYAAVILFLEPFYVAAGFGLYLNRRTLLEGWDIEVALRRIAERHAAALLSILFAGFVFFGPCFSGPALAQQKNPKEAIAEVLKAPEFGHYRDTTRWERRDPAKPPDPKTPDLTFWHAIGYALAKAAEVAL